MNPRPPMEPQQRGLLRLAIACSKKVTLAQRSPKSVSLCRSLLTNHLLDKVAQLSPEMTEAVEHFLGSGDPIPEPDPGYFPTAEDDEELRSAMRAGEDAGMLASSDGPEPPEDLFEEDTDELADDESFRIQRYTSFSVSEDVTALALADLGISVASGDPDLPQVTLERSDSGVAFAFSDEDLAPQPSPTLSFASYASVSDIDELELDFSPREPASLPHSEPIRIAGDAPSTKREIVFRGPGVATGTRSVTLNLYARSGELHSEDEDEDDAPSRSFVRPATTSRVRVGSF
ncbi:hypothetical protein DFJ74DRAFT_708185 [Hyaloraphidium curvatum]|nr:hypothetical protein DFJ74DRAFT_708185 [Hyaloraphidium curvatum]